MISDLSHPLTPAHTGPLTPGVPIPRHDDHTRDKRRCTAVPCPRTRSGESARVDGKRYVRNVGTRTLSRRMRRLRGGVLCSELVGAIRSNESIRISPSGRWHRSMAHHNTTQHNTHNTTQHNSQHNMHCLIHQSNTPVPPFVYFIYLIYLPVQIKSDAGRNPGAK